MTVTDVRPADESPRPTQVPLTAIIAADPLVAVRAALITTYVVWYVWWTFLNDEGGLIIDRISVAASLGVFLLCAFVGRPARRWLWLVVEAALYAAMWYLYEITRGNGDGTHNWFGWEWKGQLQVESVRNIDRFLFFGHDPNAVLQNAWYSRVPGQEVPWWEKLFSVTYFTHFVFPVVAMAVVWVLSQYEWRRFMKRFATLLGVACIMFFLLPTVPPWMATSSKYPYQLFDELQRPTGTGFYQLGMRGFVKKYEVAQEWGNPVAAMPSLHAGFSLFVPAFFLPWIKPRALKALVLCFPVLMLVSLVYFAEHWVIDGLVGFAIVGGSFWFWNRVERRQRHKRADAAIAALAAS